MRKLQLIIFGYFLLAFPAFSSAAGYDGAQFLPHHHTRGNWSTEVSYIKDRHGDFLNTSFDDFIKQPSAPQSPLGWAAELNADNAPNIEIVDFCMWVFFALLLAFFLWCVVPRKEEPKEQPVSDTPDIEAFPDLIQDIRRKIRASLPQKWEDKPHQKVFLCLSYSFLTFKGLADLYAALAYDSALNFMFSLLMLVGASSLLWSPTRRQSFFIAGGILAARGIINIILVAPYTSIKLLATLPLSALPNLFIAYILPLGCGLYLLIWGLTGSRAKPTLPR